MILKPQKDSKPIMSYISLYVRYKEEYMRKYLKMYSLRYNTIKGISIISISKVDNIPNIGKLYAVIDEEELTDILNAFFPKYGDK